MPQPIDNVLLHLVFSYPRFEVSSVPAAGTPYPSVTFVRRKELRSISITVEGAADPSFPSILPTSPLPSTDLGSGLERVIYRAETPTGGTSAFFFRLVVAAARPG